MLDNTTGMPSFDSLETQFRGRIGRNIVHIRKTSSTMEDARELVKLAEEIGELHGTVIIADQQTRGRGRFGRSWDSKPGKDILLSLIVCPRPSIAPQLTIMASLATALAVEALTDSTATIKWPNDVLVDGKKICGVIAEGSMIGENFAGILGIGLNVNSRPAEDAFRTYQATSIREIANPNQAINRVATLCVLLANLNELYTAIDKGESIMPEWRERLTTIGSQVAVSIPTQNKNATNEVISGIAEDIDEFGRLLIREPAGTLRAVSSGEVTTRIPPNS